MLYLDMFLLACFALRTTRPRVCAAFILVQEEPTRFASSDWWYLQRGAVGRFPGRMRSVHHQGNCYMGRRRTGDVEPSRARRKAGGVVRDLTSAWISFQAVRDSVLCFVLSEQSQFGREKIPKSKTATGIGRELAIEIAIAEVVCSRHSYYSSV